MYVAAESIVMSTIYFSLQCSQSTLCQTSYCCMLPLICSWLMASYKFVLLWNLFISYIDVVHLCLYTTHRFTDKLQLNIVNGSSRTIQLSACGRGTTLVTEPPMGSVLDLGPQFSQNVFRRTFLLRNAGRRHQNLVWSSDGFPLRAKSNSRRQTLIQETKAGKDTTSKVDSTTSWSVSCLLSVLNTVLQKFIVVLRLTVWVLFNKADVSVCLWKPHGKLIQVTSKIQRQNCRQANCEFLLTKYNYENDKFPCCSASFTDFADSISFVFAYVSNSALKLTYVVSLVVRNWL